MTKAPFPRLTLCPGSPLRDTVILHEAETLLTNGNVTLDQFYDISTLQMLERESHNDNWANRTLYDMFEVSGHVHDNPSQIGSCQTRIVLSIDLTADELRETIAFTTATLLANVGGLIGVLTGFSVFTLSGAGETMLLRFTKKCR
ncbi:hypothetical protein FJT64_001818 [Amphibalanus amphitrite]|uniref:Uncharacterized protein n=1 Tax=Amphibalanus amphitrite TaxID=1232801 RepID=A0A6A4X167_AMPAM|nr:hypothetical protein FJT64_001818 [Amphibalanus amphitrite]